MAAEYLFQIAGSQELFRTVFLVQENHIRGAEEGFLPVEGMGYSDDWKSALYSFFDAVIFVTEDKGIPGVKIFEMKFFIIEEFYVIVIIIFNNKNKDLLNQVNTISFAQGRNTDDQNLLLDDGKNGINNSE